MKEKRKLISTLFYIFFAALILIGLYQIATYGWQSAHTKKQAEELAEQVVKWQTEDGTENITSDSDKQSKGMTSKNTDSDKKKTIIPNAIDFAALQEQNPDVVAWLYCPDTVINYPIAYCGDNDKYLHRDLNLEYSREGTLFVEAENQGDFSDVNTIIYGHNMKNGSMFKTITEYVSADFYEEHPVMYLYTPGKRYEVRLLAGCLTDTDADIYTALNDTEKVKETLEQLYKKSTFLSEETWEKTEQLVTLSTCSYEYDNARYVLIGKLVEW